MPDFSNQEIREATCVHTQKIYDSCQAKDCVEGVRLYPTVSGSTALSAASSLKNGRAELLAVSLVVEPVGLGRGFYTIDLRFYYRVTADAVMGCAQSVPINGLAVFDKRSVLFGSEGGAKTFTSRNSCPVAADAAQTEANSLPTAVIEAVDPILLSMKLVDTGCCAAQTVTCTGCGCPCECDLPLGEIPAGILAAFDEAIDLTEDPVRRVVLTLGQFSILRLERDTQLMLPVYDYCLPSKECSPSSEQDDPCELFQQVAFPTSDFFPPSAAGEIDPMTRLRKGCACSQ